MIFELLKINQLGKPAICQTKGFGVGLNNLGVIYEKTDQKHGEQ